jgi:hypothetical protein
MKIDELINKIRMNSDCIVYEPSGMPSIDAKHILPEDLKNFYDNCGGVSFFPNSDYSMEIVKSNEVVLANPIIVGQLQEEDISASWYIIGNNGNNDYLTIDLDKDRNGLCYDSYFDRHAVKGSCSIISQSFTDLIENLLNNRGEYWFWLKANFKSLGDAYDNSLR